MKHVKNWLDIILLCGPWYALCAVVIIAGKTFVPDAFGVYLFTSSFSVLMFCVGIIIYRMVRCYVYTNNLQVEYVERLEQIKFPVQQPVKTQEIKVDITNNKQQEENLLNITSCCQCEVSCCTNKEQKLQQEKILNKAVEDYQSNETLDDFLSKIEEEENHIK